jgi:hypothetical protein
MICFVDASFLMKMYQISENLNCALVRIYYGDLIKVVVPSTVVITIRMFNIGVTNFIWVLIIVVSRYNTFNYCTCMTWNSALVPQHYEVLLRKVAV